MKIRNVGKEWFWISFKYENVPTFCFICGILGHFEKFCSQLFVTPEKEIIRPYGDFMRAPFKRHVKPIGAKWLRNSMDESGGSMNSGEHQSQFMQDARNYDPQSPPPNQGVVMQGGNICGQEIQKNQMSGILGIQNNHIERPIILPTIVRK